MNPLPRWRGFNLLYFFSTRSDGRPVEEDFRWIAEWGFDFVRLPMCYLLWSDPAGPAHADEQVLSRVDEAVELGRRHGLHVNLNLHRAPGYSVNRERQEPFNLWTDEAALEAFSRQWEMFARRYRGVAPAQLSFNLVNEPGQLDRDGLTRASHERVMRAAVARIRAVDPQRTVVLDGVNWGNDPLPELADLGTAQSCRGYLPMAIGHHQASWVDSRDYPEPRWPGLVQWGATWDRERLDAHYARWAELARRGVGVHCGEFGCFNRTPHAVALAWLGDVLESLAGYGIGFALWNLRGAFGLLDSGRADVAYADWHGHALDRAMLDLLRNA